MKHGFFQDGHGNNSMMRLIAFITLLAGIVLLLGGEAFRMFVDKSYQVDTVTALALFGMAFAAKWAQHKDETNKQTPK